MAKITANAIQLEYESFGAPEAPVILLIMGLGAQLTRWTVPFIELLVSRGYRVIRYDNRDIGLSTKFDAAGVPNLRQLVMAMALGQRVNVPYTLDHMAADAVGLLDALQIPRAHIVGASMGGMIAQLVAADYPQRVLSLTSMMSTTGNPMLPPPTRAAAEALYAYTAAPNPQDLEAYANYGVKTAAIIGSPRYPADPAAVRERVLADAARNYSPDGVTRQLAAVTVSGDRRARLQKITAPTVVLHGAEDPLVPVQGGEDTAACIRNAELRIIPGMGHDFPVELYPAIVDAIMRAVQRSSP